MTLENERVLPEMARHDLGAFAAQVFDCWPAPHHELWAELLTDNRLERLLIIAPPGHAKSTWCTTIYPAWLIGRNPAVNILLVSAAAAQARLFSGVIRATLQSPAYLEVFPDITLDKTRGWSQSAWFVRRDAVANKDATLAAYGVNGPIIGRRADCILVDDPCTEANTATPEARRKMWQWFRQTLLTRLRPAGRVIVVMTRWHEADLASELIHAGDFAVCHLRALGDSPVVMAELHLPGDAPDDLGLESP